MSQPVWYDPNRILRMTCFSNAELQLTILSHTSSNSFEKCENLPVSEQPWWVSNILWFVLSYLVVCALERKTSKGMGHPKEYIQKRESGGISTLSRKSLLWAQRDPRLTMKSLSKRSCLRSSILTEALLETERETETSSPSNYSMALSAGRLEFKGSEFNEGKQAHQASPSG